MFNDKSNKFHAYSLYVIVCYSYVSICYSYVFVCYSYVTRMLPILVTSVCSFSHSLPHAKLKHQLHDLLERVFNTRGKSFIATNNFHTFWANDRKSTKYTYFSRRELCNAIDFLIDNIYVRFENSVFSANYWHTNRH